MLQKEDFSKYSRQIILDEVGVKGQTLISKAKILVIGAGGLGCPLLLYLASAGVGTIGIIDFDVIELSNLHRQILFGVNDVGDRKAKVAAEKLSFLHPNCSIVHFDEKLNKSNAKDLMKGYDIIVDACDDFETRYIINDVSGELTIPTVYGAIQKFEGQVGVFNYRGSKKYSDLFPHRHTDSEIFNCEVNGVLGVVPGLIGLFQANEVLKLILNVPEKHLLVNRILVYNFMNHNQSIVRY
jgi:adenylyltransferase/sulfurtransferase